MGRKPAPRPLALSEIALPTSEYARPETAQTTQVDSRDGSVISSTMSPASPPPMSPFYTDHNSQSQTQTNQQPPVHVVDLIHHQAEDETLYNYEQQAQQTQQEQQRNQPPPPQQQQRQQPVTGSQGYGRSRQNEEKHSKSSFFRFGKSSTARSNERLASNNRPTDTRNDTMSRGADVSTSGAAPKPSDASYMHPEQHIAANVSGAILPAQSETASASTTTEADPSSALARKGKQKTFARLGRSRSNRDDDNGSPHPLNSANIAKATGLQEAPPIRVAEPPGAPLKTAPITQRDRAFRDMMSSSARTHSADRAQQRDLPGQRDGPRGDRDRDHHRMQPSSLRDNSGSTFFNGLRNSSRSAADMISKGLFGKSTRSGSTTEREPVVDDEHYVLKVINRPLVEQTRMTRISKRLEDSRDKTEFWMPSFPWRAIDYLNYKGTDVEGLYRVPGSGPQIKRWQRKFDEECDVDLFGQEDLYDINIIGSMLKAWLRELPDELFPKDAQERIARECAGAETVPQMLIDELSSLPPYNYYLLFAITCHLSLLLAHSDKNKMDFRNLCICFQPCMKIDAFSFKFLVCDWRDCWKGCIDEPRYIEEEYRLMNAPVPRSIAFQSPQQTGLNTEQARVSVEPPENENDEQRPVSDDEESKATKAEEHHSASSDSSKQSDQNADSSKAHVKRKNNTTAETGSVASNSTLSTTLTIDSQRMTTPPGQSGDLRPLSPIKPLSPLGF